jgi:hypothetical protein
MIQFAVFGRFKIARNHSHDHLRTLFIGRICEYLHKVKGKMIKISFFIRLMKILWIHSVLLEKGDT